MWAVGRLSLLSRGQFGAVHRAPAPVAPPIPPEPIEVEVAGVEAEALAPPVEPVESPDAVNSLTPPPPLPPQEAEWKPVADEPAEPAAQEDGPDDGPVREGDNVVETSEGFEWEAPQEVPKTRAAIAVREEPERPEEPIEVPPQRPEETPVSAPPQEAPATPEVTEATIAPELPESPEPPETPQTPELPEAPEAPEPQETTEAPETTESPETTEASEVQDAPPSIEPAPAEPVQSVPAVPVQPAPKSAPESEVRAVAQPASVRTDEEMWVFVPKEAPKPLGLIQRIVRAVKNFFRALFG